MLMNSWGGAQAMIRLGENPTQYPGLDLSRCGLLFLATPHSGTDEANWSDFLVEVAKVGGVRRGRDLTDLLSSFNRESTNAKERFGLLRPLPPFICVYETQRTAVKGTQRVVSVLPYPRVETMYLLHLYADTP